VNYRASEIVLLDKSPCKNARGRRKDVAYKKRDRKRRKDTRRGSGKKVEKHSQQRLDPGEGKYKKPARGLLSVRTRKIGVKAPSLEGKKKKS